MAAIEVILPKVDMDMESGVIVAWKVAEGDRVQAGDILFDMETDKAMMEVEAPGSGVIRGLAQITDQPIAVGTPVAWIDPDSVTPRVTDRAGLVHRAITSRRIGMKSGSRRSFVVAAVLGASPSRRTRPRHRRSRASSFCTRRSPSATRADGRRVQARPSRRRGRGISLGHHRGHGQARRGIRRRASRRPTCC